MLREIERTQQRPGEPMRRWFFSHEMDLLLWVGENGEPVAFQLCYGKYHDEHAIRWKADRGYSHYRVDDGEDTGIASDAPILHANGTFNANSTLSRFRELAAEIPVEYVQFVTKKITEHPDYREDT